VTTVDDDAGFVRDPQFYTLAFDRGELKGLEIRVRGLSGNGLAELHTSGATAENPLPGAPLFIEQVDRWNLKRRDSSSVRISLDAFLDYDLAFLSAVLATWLQEVPMVPAAAPDPAADPADLTSADEEEWDGPALSEFTRYSTPGTLPAAA
jgi:hypothetical protein